MVSFHCVRKIRDYLAKAKIYPLEQNGGSKKYKKSRCEVCNNIESTDFFSSTVTGNTYKINHYFNCNSKCLVYLICRTCKQQLSGQTFDAFWKCWNHYRFCAKKVVGGVKNVNSKICMNTFYKTIIMLNDGDVTLINKTQASDPTKKEYFWMEPLKRTTHMV